MDKKLLNQSLTAIIEKRLQLNGLTYDNKDYDKVEEELHDLEDLFMDNFGDDLEEVLEDVHEKLCPDNEVLMPIAYLAQNYVKGTKNPDGTTAFDVVGKEGVWVDVEKYDGKDTRLVFVSNPTRLLLMVEGKAKEVVWQA